MKVYVMVLVFIAQCGGALNVFGQVDQEHMPPASPYVSNIVAESATSSPTVEWSQTFKVGITGRLTGLDISVARNATVTEPLLFDIRTTAGGLPTEPNVGANILASGSVAMDLVPEAIGGGPASMTHVDTTGFSLDVTAGDTLAIVLRSTSPGTYGYSWYGALPGGYANGRAYVRYFGRFGNSGGWITQNQDVDQGFRTYVAAIPEPAALSMLSVALIGIALCFRRRVR